ncbi:HAMP domain-containing sensor histidine kinase [Chryseobacterium sp.]|uniref:sensor histidine kinase n=1 Tax=Chryseobacterium sp. TaxID=1871047 RepID=UPI0028A0BEA2|nr:HAMP domain-containing sensor histidine kinase [Chryseobacterium sp.]
MIYKTKYRQFIHYSLIASTLLIQIGIAIFFYNEYFNEKKLSVIQEQIQSNEKLKIITDSSRVQLVNAQKNLQKYISGDQKKFLEQYFVSLRNVSENIDKINTYENKSQFLEKTIKSQRDELTNLKNLVESAYQESQKSLRPKEKIEIKKIDLKTNADSLEISVKHNSDTTTQKKGFFPRLKDAFNGNVDVKRDTTFITTTYKSSLDTSKIKFDFDSTITAVNDHYVNEIKKYQSHLATSKSKNKNLYHIYDNLIGVSNQLMEVYNGKINDFGSKLKKQYDEQNSINNKIRKYSVLGMMVLMFVVLIILMYYTKLSFLYEKELKIANEKIRSNLNFKSRILGMLSHEIRSPLKIINLFISRIQKKTDDEVISDYLKSIQFTNESLLIQASQILDYTKNQEKKSLLKPVEFNLKDEIDAILKIFKPYIESKKNSFEISNSIDSQTVVFSDNIKIHQLFINILGNANKFTENGSISVTCETKNVNPETAELFVEISDTGIGISRSDLAKIFEPYYQGNISDEIENLGAGLGLNLCKEIIDLFGGKINVHSKFGQGTTVSFSINLKLVK